MSQTSLLLGDARPGPCNPTGITSSIAMTMNSGNGKFPLNRRPSLKRSVSSSYSHNQSDETIDHSGPLMSNQNRSVLQLGQTCKGLRRAIIYNFFRFHMEIPCNLLHINESIHKVMSFKQTVEKLGSQIKILSIHLTDDYYDKATSEESSSSPRSSGASDIIYCEYFKRQDIILHHISLILASLKDLVVLSVVNATKRYVKGKRWRSMRANMISLPEEMHRIELLKLCGNVHVHLKDEATPHLKYFSAGEFVTISSNPESLPVSLQYLYLYRCYLELPDGSNRVDWFNKQECSCHLKDSHIEFCEFQVGYVDFEKLSSLENLALLYNSENSDPGNNVLTTDVYEPCHDMKSSQKSNESFNTLIDTNQTFSPTTELRPLRRSLRNLTLTGCQLRLIIPALSVFPNLITLRVEQGIPPNMNPESESKVVLDTRMKPNSPHSSLTDLHIQGIDPSILPPLINESRGGREQDHHRLIYIDEILLGRNIDRLYLSYIQVKTLDVTEAISGSGKLKQLYLIGCHFENFIHGLDHNNPNSAVINQQSTPSSPNRYNTEEFGNSNDISSDQDNSQGHYPINANIFITDCVSVDDNLEALQLW